MDTQETSSAVRFAGAAFVVIILLGVAQDTFVSSPLMVPGDAAATVGKVAARPGLFRLGVLVDVVLYVLVLLLSGALYWLVRAVNGPLALAAASFDSRRAS